MSTNLALKLGNNVDFNILYQTPTSVTRDALKSSNPFAYYRDWLYHQRGGNFMEETEQHMKKVVRMVEEGYYFVAI